MLWLLDPRNESSPDNATAAAYRHLDPISIWAYWSRQFTHPFYIDAGHGKGPLGTGYVYDLRTMVNFAPPEGDVRPLIKSLLQEADLLRMGSIPSRAFVEINFPPFVALVFEEVNPAFVLVEALDAHDRVLPIYLFPSACRWSVPNTGCSPDGQMASFDDVVRVLVAMAAAALRDFWVIEDRDRVLGPPRIARIPGSKRAEPSPTFPTGGVRAPQMPIEWGVGRKSLHYTGWAGARAIWPAAVIRGGGCGGSSRLSCLTKSFWSALSSVWRLSTSVRPSVVGK